MRIKRNLLFPAALLFILVAIAVAAAPIIMQKNSLAAAWFQKNRSQLTPQLANGSSLLPDTGLQGQVAQAASSDCTYHYYYWKAHPELWPGSLALGQLTITKQQAKNLFQSNVGIDKQAAGKDPIQYLTLEAYITSLNINQGASSYGIQETLTEAENWLANKAKEKTGSSFDGSIGVNLAQHLDDYNNGFTGPGLCDNQPPLPTITATQTPSPTPTTNLSTNAPKKQLIDSQVQSESVQNEQNQPAQTTSPTPLPTATSLPTATVQPTATPVPPSATPLPPAAKPHPPKASPPHKPSPPKATPKPPAKPSKTTKPPHNLNQPPDQQGHDHKKPKDNQNQQDNQHSLVDPIIMM